MVKKIFVFILLFSLSTFCKKIQDLPRYQPMTQIDDEIANFLNKEDSLSKKIVNRWLKNKTTRDILGRLTKDTTLYILRPELIEKRIPVGIIDLTPRNKQDENAIEFYRNQNGEKSVYMNGKKISLDGFRKIIREKSERKIEPFIRYESLTAQEIKKLILGSKPVRVFLQKKVPIQKTYSYYHYSITFGYTGVNGMHSVGAKGDGVGIFFAEDGGCPDVGVLNEDYFIQSGICSSPSLHATMVAKLLQLTAPEATVVNFVDHDVVIPSVEQNANLFNPTLEIGSYSWQYSGDGPCVRGLYCYRDQQLDQHIYEKRLIYFIGAGNKDYEEDVYVSSPGIALNAIAVGAVDPETGTYVSYSKWKNSELQNQKPEIANYTNFYLGNKFSFDGTSCPTPYSAAIAANILSVDSDLKRHPEVMKSIFLVHATKPINGASTHDLDDKFSVSYGLPYFDVNKGFWYKWWSGSNTDFFNSNKKILFTIPGLASGLHCRAAISWLTSGSYAGEHKSLAQDLDLFVYQYSNDNLLGFSQSWENPFEVVDFTTIDNTNLKFEIKRYANSQSDDVVLGFAMRCDYE